MPNFFRFARHNWNNLAFYFVIVILAMSVTAVAGDFCWRKSYGRTAGTVPTYQCGLDQVQSKDALGVLCYPKCKEGYTAVGPVCWQNCPAGYRDDGGFCGKPAPYYQNATATAKLGCPAGSFRDPNGICYTCPSGYYRTLVAVTASTACAKSIVGPFSAATSVGKSLSACPTGSFFDPNGSCYSCPTGSVRTANAVTSNQACAVEPKCDGLLNDIGVSCTKKSYGNTAGTVAKPVCENGKQADGLLCYPICSGEYKGGGPTCWQSCDRTTLKTECGMGCSTDKSSCGEATTDMVMSVFDAATNILMLVATGGVSSIKDYGQGILQTALTDVPNISEDVAIASFCAADVNGCKDVKQQDLRLVGSIIVAAKKGEEWKPNAQMLQDVKLFDPTGIVGIIAAYSKEMCDGDVPKEAYQVDIKYLPPLPSAKMPMSNPIALPSNSGKLYYNDFPQFVRTDDRLITAYQVRDYGQVSFDQGKQFQPNIPALHMAATTLAMVPTDKDPGTGSILTWVDPSNKVFTQRFGGPLQPEPTPVAIGNLNARAATTLSDGSLLTINQNGKIEFRGNNIFIKEFDDPNLGANTASGTMNTKQQQSSNAAATILKWVSYLTNLPQVSQPGGFRFISSRGMQAVASTDDRVYLITVKSVVAPDNRRPPQFTVSFEALPPPPLRYRTVANPQITALDIDNLGRVWIVDKTEHVTVLIGGARGRWQPLEMLRGGKEVLGRAVAVIGTSACVIEPNRNLSDKPNNGRPQITCSTSP